MGISVLGNMGNMAMPQRVVSAPSGKLDLNCDLKIFLRLSLGIARVLGVGGSLVILLEFWRS